MPRAQTMGDSSQADDGLKDEPEQKNINKKQNPKRIEQAKKNEATKNTQQTK